MNFEKRLQEKKENKNEEDEDKNRKWKSLQDKYKQLFDINPNMNEKTIQKILKRQWIYEKEIRIARDARKIEEEKHKEEQQVVFNQYQKVVQIENKRKAEKQARLLIASTSNPQHMDSEIELDYQLLRSRQTRLQTFRKNELCLSPVRLNQVQQMGLRHGTIYLSKMPLQYKSLDYLNWAYDVPIELRREQKTPLSSYQHFELDESLFSKRVQTSMASIHHAK